MTVMAWKSVEADTHEAKADAFASAIDRIYDVIEAAEPTTRPVLSAALQALAAEKGRHEKEAKLLRSV